MLVRQYNEASKGGEVGGADHEAFIVTAGGVDVAAGIFFEVAVVGEVGGELTAFVGELH